MPKKRIGEVTHYYTGIEVGVIKLEDELKVGDRISIEGATTDFEQDVKSMEIQHEKIKAAEPGDEIGLKVKERVREGDTVFKLE